MEKNMTQAIAYWIETPLTNVQKLCDQTFSYSIESETNCMKELYADDLKDFKLAISLFRRADPEALSQHVYFLDTSAREQLVVAFKEDCGSQFVEEVLGYEVA
tara:strand:- start:1568 stop:1876 length:309 start_codon:yes stop_codon:yes gene_type:complete